MLDCGCSLDRPWFPSIAFARQRIDTLIIQNLDEDHVQDFQDVWRDVPIGAIFSNPTVSADALKWMKSQGMRSGVKQAHALLQAFGTGMMGNWDQWLGGVAWQAFYNPFGGVFHDTNNLSLAVFVSFGGFTILFGGDMEEKGWKNLILNPAFVARLTEVNVYVASHHGRDNGCCDPLMAYMQPELVIFSDGQKQHETQETARWYAQRTCGIPDYGGQTNSLLGPPLRKVMTTRKDGTLTIAVQASGDYLVTPSKRQQTNDELLTSILAGLSPLTLAPAPGLNGLARFAGVPTPALPPPSNALADYFAMMDRTPSPDVLAGLAPAPSLSPLVNALLSRR